MCHNYWKAHTIKYPYVDCVVPKEPQVSSSPAVMTIATTKSRSPVSITKIVSNNVIHESLAETNLMNK